MAKSRRKPDSDSEFVLFNVVYEDGSLRSNRKVPSVELGGLDGDDPAKAIIEAQDRKISELSGKPTLAIKTIVRSGR